MLRIITRRTIVMVLCTALAGGAQLPNAVRRFTATMPLDNELIELMPSGKKLSIMATWDCAEIEGWELVTLEDKKLIRDAEGRKVEFYPEHMRFRFTIGSKAMIEGRSPLPYDTVLSPDELSSGLRFKLKRFHEIESTEFEPVSQELIGVPEEIPYNERIYSIEFRIPKVPLEDRFALEVLDPSGNRVAKFTVFLL
jgi:hypothetical protein